jgi:hypothetical protein
MKRTPDVDGLLWLRDLRPTLEPNANKPENQEAQHQ